MENRTIVEGIECMKQILILGGGAAGIIAAIAAAENSPDCRVTILEKNPRIGKKLLATGNGRCNLDNTSISPDCYFTSDQNTMKEMLAHIDRADPLGWFRQHGLLCRCDEAGRIYPYSNQAADVLNLLLYWLEQQKVELRCGCAVRDIDRRGAAYVVTAADGQRFMADAVICALGGKAGPQFGTDGFGLELARLCGCAVEPGYPCLVPLNSEKKQIAGLSGVRVKGEISLWDGERPLRTENGEVQFTDYGISGIAVMQLSGLLGPHYHLRQPEIHVDLFPHLAEQELVSYLQERSRLLPETDARGFMTGLVHPRVGAAVWKAADMGKEERKLSTLSSGEWGKLAHSLKCWRFRGLSPTDWKNAQTTGGGIALSQLCSDSFQLRGCEGLYFVGETVDCAGCCGGYNLHWVFGSGLLAGHHAAMLLKNQRKSSAKAPKTQKSAAKKKKKS